MRFRKSISAATLTLAIALLSSSPAAATAAWKEICHQAFKLQKSGDWIPAWEKYKEAITLLDSDRDKDPDLINELQLNMATMQIQAGNYSNGMSALEVLKPQILTAKNSDSLQAMRFWRRVVDASRALQKNEEAVKAQENVIRIAETHFQSESPFCLEERRILLLILVDAGKVQEAAKLADQLEHLAETMSSVETKKRFEGSIGVFFGKTHIRFWNCLDQGKIREGAELLHINKKRYKTAEEYMSWVDALREKALAIQSPEAPKLVSEAQSCAEKLIPNRKALEVYIKSLDYHVNARTRRGKYDAQLEKILRKMIAAEDKLVSPEKRNEDIRYIQSKCLLACTLAKLGEVDQSEKMADTVRPSSATFSNSEVFDAVYQARINGLADAFVQRKDKEGVKRQFRKLTDLYRTMAKISDKEKLLTVWSGVEQQYLQRLQSQ